MVQELIRRLNEGELSLPLFHALRESYWETESRKLIDEQVDRSKAKLLAKWHWDICKEKHCHNKFMAEPYKFDTGDQLRHKDEGFTVEVTGVYPIDRQYGYNIVLNGVTKRIKPQQVLVNKEEFENTFIKE